MNLKEKQNYAKEYLLENGFDLDQINTANWSESQCEEFLNRKERGIEEARIYIESLTN